MPFNDLLKEEEMDKFLEQCPPHRQRIFSPDQTLLAFLAQVISPMKSCKQAVIDMLSYKKLNDLTTCSIKTSSYSRARQKIPLEAIVNLTKNISKSMEDAVPKQWLWKNRKVRLLDGSTVTMADSVENQLFFPQHTNQKKGLGFPLARMSAMTSLETGSVIDFEMGPWIGKGTGELFLGSKILNTLEGNEVVVADAFYMSYFFISNVKKKNADVLTRLKGNRNFIIISSEKIGDNDRLILVKKPRIPHTGWVDKNTYEQSPDELLLRETTFISKKQGFRDKKFILISTFINKKEYSSEKIAELYSLRWNVELDFRTIKKTIGLDFLKCKTPAMALKEAWVYLLAYNLIRRIIKDAAVLSESKPRDISFSEAVMVYSSFKSALLLSFPFDAHMIYKYMLVAISKCKIYQRPGRLEPRALKRRINYNDYSRLKLPRHIWRFLTILPELELEFSSALREVILKLGEDMPKSNYANNYSYLRQKQ